MPVVTVGPVQKAAEQISVPGFVNIRGLGGYVGGGGRVVRAGSLLRSDMPARLSSEATRLLRAHGVVTVIDLRDDAEVRETGPVFSDAGFTVVRRPLFDGSAASFVERRVTLTELYHHLVRARGTTLTAAVQAIADSASHGGVLVHCSAGKDRTGVTVALTLGAIGVRTADIVRDYVATEARLAGPWLDERLRVLQAHHGRDLSDSVELLAGSPASAITAALDAVEHGWGSPRRYLLAHGAGPDELDRLRDRLTVPAAGGHR